jgi:hypothetical protein
MCIPCTYTAVSSYIFHDNFTETLDAAVPTVAPHDVSSTLLRASPLFDNSWYIVTTLIAGNFILALSILCYFLCEQTFFLSTKDNAVNRCKSIRVSNSTDESRKGIHGLETE